ncbi:MAM and LDL-receptor class A domain-containing protein 2 [Holothuria leucospilota]|uniref:MAM and LDL-receptor class A domain-containing protein 2 n=1 Tax=Holothuria leucospilota TaxID=206669 RepID=A0A9Q0YHW5_HOLLE|nr:MAM and LDL-receptor class A domain-containing protein 2 [Holothuria leucospilota]
MVPLIADLNSVISLGFTNNNDDDDDDDGDGDGMVMITVTVTVTKQLVLVGCLDNRYTEIRQGSYAIILLTNSELNCTFEYGTCGYYQTAEDDFDWTRHQGSTPSSGTGPSGDHTTGTGYYMYIETTSVPAYWTARLASSSQDATDNQGLCLSFFYHMYGYNINTLSVFLSTRGNEELIFRRSQYQGDRWLRATTQFRSSSTWRIIFEGRRGRDYQGDIAIDDISIFPGPCPTEGSNWATDGKFDGF